jgi:hypothetical protein
MLSIKFCKTDNKINYQQGFAVLTSAITLSAASIIFTANMASSQLVDNQIIGNYYRNKEAFANAESGINFVIGKLDDSAIAQAILTNLPTSYKNTAQHYSVNIQKIHATKMSINSIGTSQDKSAQREINLEIDFYINYPIPKAAVSTNGKINLGESALVNDGCEGQSIETCKGSGNIAEHMLISNPSLEVDEVDEVDDADELCSGGHKGKNIIASGVLQGDSEPLDTVTKELENETQTYDWGKVSIASGSEIGGVSSNENMQAGSLFEATFGIEMSQINLDELSNNAVSIDMSHGGNCSSMLQNVGDENEIIFIKGDCNISQYYAQKSETTQNKFFTIGSSEHPKLVFIEGGTFISPPNIGTTVIGMLYFLPSLHDEIDEQGNIQAKDDSVDMGRVNVNGALLSEYKCSYNSDDKIHNSQTLPHFSARFDKLILNKLYSSIGIRAMGSGYRFSAGTWRDF